MPTLLQEKFERLVAFPPTTFPVISLYLNAEPDQHGKDDVERFLRRELAARGRTFEPVYGCSVAFSLQFGPTCQSYAFSYPSVAYVDQDH